MAPFFQGRNRDLSCTTIMLYPYLMFMADDILECVRVRPEPVPLDERVDPNRDDRPEPRLPINDDPLPNEGALLSANS